MTALVTTFIYFSSIGVITLDIFVIFSFVFFIVSLFDAKARASIPASRKGAFFASYALALAWVVALVSMLLSLFFSEIAGFVACKLCWYQRLFFYPQVLILLIPVFNRTPRVKRYVYWSVLILSVIGAGIAVFHYYGQTINPSVLPCGITPTASSCAQIPFNTFGYITIPLMSLTGFLTQIALMVWYKLSNNVRS